GADAEEPEPETCDLEVDLDANDVPDCEESLVEDSQFASGVSGWIPPNGGSIAHAPDVDARNNPASGSLVVTNEVYSPDTAGNTLQHAIYCVPVESGTKYRIAAQLFLPSGQSDAAKAELIIHRFANATCSGTGAQTMIGQLSATD